MGFLDHLVLLGTFATLGLGQDCPIFGPAYPETVNPVSSTPFIAAKAAIEDEIARGFASGQLGNDTVFAIQVFSRHSNEILHEHYYGPSVDSNTLFRVASISKVISVYTTLTEVGDQHWNDLITKYIPELAEAKVQNPVYDVDWSEVTLGAIASHMGGIPRDCGSFIPPWVNTILTRRRLVRRRDKYSPRSHSRVSDLERDRADQVRRHKRQAVHQRGFALMLSRYFIVPSANTC